MGRDIRSAPFRKSQHLTIDEFNRFGSASMITRCTNNITQIQQAYMTIIEMLLPAPIMSIVGLILAFSKSPALAMLIVLSMIAVCALTLSIGSKAMSLLSSLQTKLDDINRTLRKHLMGIRVIRAFNRSEHERRNSNEAYEEYASMAIRVNKIFATLLPLAMGLMNACIVAIIAIGGQNAANERMGIDNIMALIEYASLIVMYLVMGISVFLIIPRAQTCANRVNEVLNLSSDKNATTPGLDGTIPNVPKLEFRDVTFRYQSAEEPVLHNVSFTARTGETTAIIGGQRQRLAIARALVRKPDIYVFDDSFSALDFKTDAKLRAALKQETKNAAVILVAQRISTIMDVEQIVVLDEGRVAGIGTHEQLMTSCEVYRQIAESQLSEKELA